MRNFFKTLFTSCLGTILALSLLVGGVMIYLSISSSPKENLNKKSILKLDFSEFIPEKTGNVQENSYSINTSENIGLRSIIRMLSQAKSDPMVSGILINSHYVSGGQATMHDIRAALEDFKDSGKFVYSYADFYSQSAYWMASIADSIFLNPNGNIDLKGYGVAIPFYKELMDKAGIKMNIFYAGKYKSATEQYRRTDISPENREQTTAFLNDMLDVVLSQVSSSRNIPEEQLKSLTSQYAGGKSSTSLSSGLVDQLIYWEDLESWLKEKLGIKASKKIDYVSLQEYAGYLKSDYKSSVKDKIAIINAEGEILYGNKNKGVINDEKYLKIFDKVLNDENIKGVVFRVNSPGGNSLVSDNISQGIKRLKEKGIPIIASFGDYAASGGYYISMFADSIVSAPNTLTGSIGVYVMFPNVRKLLNEKIGITFDTIKTDPLAVSFNPYLDLTKREEDHMKDFTNELYQRFITLVSEGRNLTVEHVDSIAQGHVWTGKRALELGLVDEIGNLQDAIDIAAEKAGIEEYNVTEYPYIKKSPWKELVKSLAPEQAQVNFKSPIETKLLQGYSHYRSFLSDTKPQTKLPYIFYWN